MTGRSVTLGDCLFMADSVCKDFPRKPRSGEVLANRIGRTESAGDRLRSTRFCNQPTSFSDRQLSAREETSGSLDESLSTADFVGKLRRQPTTGPSHERAR
jgi:hypothetical protein